MFDRIATVTMRPMSLFEAGASTGAVHVGDLVLSPRHAASGVGTGADLVDIVELLCIGGWPRTLGMSVSDAGAMNRQRVNAIATTEVASVGGRSDPARVARMLRSLARNIATYVSLVTLADDTAMAGAEQPIDPGTARRYVDALKQLMVVEELPAWQPHLRSKAQMRSGPKMFLVDPALACAALDAGPQTLLRDPNYLGFLFEAMVLRDLRVYSPPGCTLSQYRDNKGHEVDAICQAGDGRWAAFEVKLGRTDPDPAKDPIEPAAASLRHFADTMIDPDKVPAPSSLNVIVASGVAYQRSDGVNVIPVTSLGP